MPAKMKYIVPLVAAPIALWICLDIYQVVTIVRHHDTIQADKELYIAGPNAIKASQHTRLAMMAALKCMTSNVCVYDDYIENSLKGNSAVLALSNALGVPFVVDSGGGGQACYAMSLQVGEDIKSGVLNTSFYGAAFSTCDQNIGVFIRRLSVASADRAGSIAEELDVLKLQTYLNIASVVIIIVWV